MKIGGFVKQSLIDYPGKIAAVVFTQGCNFRCGYCHNPRLVLPELFQNNPEYSLDNILDYLEERKNWLDAVVVTGGEPTIHKDLPGFLKRIKDMGYHVKLDTNGSDPSMLELIVKEKLVDYIAMDIKTILHNELYAKLIGIENVEGIIENILSSIVILKNTSIEGEFRTTSIPGIHNKIIIELIRKFLGSAKKFVINDFRKNNTIGDINRVGINN